MRYYKGVHKVRVLTQSKGNWIVEALEAFEDCVEGQTILVKVGEQRIVSPNLLFKSKTFRLPVPEHEYELKMERKVKQMITDAEKNKNAKH